MERELREAGLDRAGVVVKANPTMGERWDALLSSTLDVSTGVPLEDTIAHAVRLMHFRESRAHERHQMHRLMSNDHENDAPSIERRAQRMRQCRILDAIDELGRWEDV